MKILLIAILSILIACETRYAAPNVEGQSNPPVDTLDRKLFLGSGSAAVADESIGRQKSIFVSNDALRFYINAIFQAEQGVATPHSIQGVEGFTKATHPSGLIVLAIGTIGNVEMASVATVAEARAVQAGIVITNTGTVSRAIAIYGGMANPGKGTITDGYGLYVDRFPTGVAKKWNIYLTDPEGESFMAGKVRMPDLPTSSVGLLPGSLWNNGGVVSIVP